MKKSLLLPLSLLAISLVACNFSSGGGKGRGRSQSTQPTSQASDSEITTNPTNNTGKTSNTSNDPTSSSDNPTSSTSSGNSSNTASNPTSNPTTSIPTSTSTGTDPYIPSSSSNSSWTQPELPSEFSLTNESGLATGFVYDGSSYTINTAGTYILSGTFNGYINIEVGEEDTVELDLNGVSLTSSNYSPIFAKTANKLKVKAMKNTSNIIKDNRSVKTSDNDAQGEGAISAKCDLNIIGSGTLQVEGNYNNGIHTSKDLKIKNIQLKVYGNQHALRGGNSIEILNETTLINATAKTGDGLKSADAGTSSSGKQKGNITITGGNIIINSFNDGIDAAYNAIVSDGVDEDNGNATSPTINIYTETYASLSKIITRPPGGGGGWDNGGNNNKSSTTAKGIKACNEVQISGGQIYIKAYDDGIHANSEVLTDSDDVSLGVYGTGNVTISGGNTTIACADDGIHADNILDINGGVLTVTESYEGIEGHEVRISGGNTVVTASDDGVNAGGNGSPKISVSGGYLEVNVNPSADTDGVDSNGIYTQTGGVVITKGPNSSNMSALDHEGEANISGGTLIVLGAIEGSSGGGGSWGGMGAGSVTVASSMKTYTLSLHSKGSHSININGTQYTFTNAYAYGKTTCYSDTSVTGS